MNKKAIIALLIATAVAVAVFVMTRDEDHDAIYTPPSVVGIESNPEAKALCASQGETLTQAWSSLFDVILNEEEDEAVVVTTARNGFAATDKWVGECQTYLPEKAAELQLLVRNMTPVIDNLDN